MAEIPNLGFLGGGCPPPAPNVYNVFVIGLDNTGFDTSNTTVGCPSDHFELRIFGTSLAESGVFTINLNDGSVNDPNGRGGWVGATFTNSVTTTKIDNVVPEPATYGLLGAGLAGLAILRRRRSV